MMIVNSSLLNDTETFFSSHYGVEMWNTEDIKRWIGQTLENDSYAHLDKTWLNDLGMYYIKQSKK